jgi:hypothetical protein
MTACTAPSSRCTCATPSGVNRSRGWHGHLWQGRFFSSPLDEPYLWAALHDVERNPVRGSVPFFSFHAYTLVLGRPPAEADLQRHFRVTPPSVHQMVLTLARAGLIRRRPGVARSIEVLVDPEALPVLRLGHDQPVKSSVQRY